MSRAQQGQVFNQTSGESKQAFGDTENSLKLAQTDVGNYQSQLAQYAKANPYVAGGEFQSDQNRVLGNTADAQAQAAGARLQSQAARTGQNPAGAIAATEAMQQENERSLAGQEAAADASRIGQQAEYNKGVLGATAVPVGMETQIAGEQAGLYKGALGAEEDAARTPSFMDTLGNAFSSGLGNILGGGANFGGHHV